MRRKKSPGYSAIEVMLMIGFVGVLAYAVMSLGRLTQKMSSATITTFQADAFRKRIVGLLQSDAAWKNIVQDARNSTLECLRNDQDCSGKTGPLVLLDASGLEIYNSIELQNGFSASGENCNSFNPTNGNRACPFRLNVNWTAVCPASGECKTPQVKIDGTVQYSPEKGYEGNVSALNLNQFEFHIIRGQEQVGFGTGTPGTIAKYNSSVELGDSPLVEGADGKIAFGLSGPALSKLDVSGNMAIGGYASTVIAPNNGLLVSGRVGVGVASPSAALDVAGPGRITAENPSCEDGNVGEIRFFNNRFEGCRGGSEKKWCLLGGCGTTCRDPDWAKVLLLLHFNGSHGSSNFQNSSIYSSYNVQATGAYLSTAGYRFKTASGHFKGSDYLSLNHNVPVGTGDFTLEFFAFAEDVTSAGEIFGGQLRLRFNAGQLEIDPDSVTGCSAASGGWTTGQWYHIAVVREGLELRVYRDGQRVGVDSSCSYNFSNLFSRIGGKATGGDGYRGYLDEIRVTAGKARYAGVSATPVVNHFSDASESCSAAPSVTLGAATP